VIGAALCLVCGRELGDDEREMLCSVECARGLAQDVLQARPAAMMLARLAKQRGTVPDAHSLLDARRALESTIDRVEQARADGTIPCTRHADEEWVSYAARLRKVAEFLDRLALSE
jgi:predicted nucleic acid-binding Zn ribbon protein